MHHAAGSGYTPRTSPAPGATMLHALTLGRTFGLVTINPAFVPWLHDQIIRLGLTRHSVGVRALDTQVHTYMRAYEDPAAFDEVKEAFAREATKLVEASAIGCAVPSILIVRISPFAAASACFRSIMRID